MPEKPPAVVYWLAAAILAAQVALMFAPGWAQERAFATFAVIPERFDPASADAFRRPFEPIEALLGHAFLHGGWLHLGMNLLVLLQVAGAPARRFEAEEPGALRFLALFFGSAVAGGLAYVWINPGSATPAVGASGAVCGVFAAYLLAMGRTWRDAFSDRRVLSAGFWFLAVNVGLAAWARTSGFLPIAWEAHLGGFIGGLALYPLLAPRWRTSPWAP